MSEKEIAGYEIASVTEDEMIHPRQERCWRVRYRRKGTRRYSSFLLLQAVYPTRSELLAAMDRHSRPDPDLGGDYAAEWKDGEAPKEES